MMRKWWLWHGVAAAACALRATFAQDVRHGPVELSLDSLLNLKISTAAKYEQTISEAPASVTIVNADEISRCGYRTLDEVLDGVRGFYTSYDRNYSYLGVRGFSRPTDYNDRILILIDGHTTNENVYGSTFIGTDLALNMRSIERIEIVRGPSSALYGTGAVFAVVNIITKRGRSAEGFRIAAEQGSYRRLGAAAELGKEFDNGVDLFVSGIAADIKGQDLYYPEYDSLQYNNGIAQHLDWDRYYGFLAKISYKGFSLLGNLRSREKGIPTGAFDIVFNDQSAKTLDEQKIVELKHTAAVGAEKTITARAYYDHYGYRGTYPYSAVSFDATDGNSAGSEFQFRWDFQPDNRLTLGAEYKNNVRADYRLWDSTRSYFDGDFPFSVFSLYVQDEYQIIPDLMLTFGIRRDSYSSAGSSTSPRGAIVLNPFKSATMKVLYGAAFRAPSVYEVNYQDPTTNYKVNPSLRSESIRTTEVVWEQRLGEEFFGVISLYNYRMNDLIDPVIDPSDSMKQFQNVSAVTASGIELELKARMRAGLHGYGNYAFQNAKDADRGKTLTNSPAHLLKVGCITSPLWHFSLAAEMQYETSRRTVYGKKTGSYVLANLNISTEQILDHLGCSILVRNLFDVAYKTPGGLEHRQAAILQDGRNYTVRIEYAF